MTSPEELEEFLRERLAIHRIDYIACCTKQNEDGTSQSHAFVSLVNKMYTIYNNFFEYKGYNCEIYKDGLTSNLILYMKCSHDFIENGTLSFRKTRPKSTREEIKHSNMVIINTPFEELCDIGFVHKQMKGMLGTAKRIYHGGTKITIPLSN